MKLLGCKSINFPFDILDHNLSATTNFQYALYLMNTIQTNLIPYGSLLFIKKNYYLSTWCRITETWDRVRSSRHREENVIGVVRKHGDFILTVHSVVAKFCYPFIKQLLRLHLHKISGLMTFIFKITNKEIMVFCAHQTASLANLYRQCIRKVFLRMLLPKCTLYELRHDRRSITG